MQDRYILGVDVGGSGIKGAIVDTHTGEFQSERVRLETPQPATPAAVAKTFSELVKAHQYKGVIGCGFPAIVKQGVAQSAANISEQWIGKNIIEALSLSSACPVEVLNDADAAGMAEMAFGLGRGVSGMVLLITIGSGLGSALFMDGKLVPNTEFGHIQMKGNAAELYASNKARKTLELGWEEWGQRFDEYLLYIQRILNPDLILLGGGVSKKFEKFEAQLSVDIEVKPAELKNQAGIIGAALHARKQMRSR